MSNLSRRTLVASAAALPAVAMPAVAIIPDPALAAVERWRVASEIHGAVCERETDAQTPEEYSAWDDRAREACHASYEAMVAMVQTRPTTNAGIRAMVRLYLEEDGLDFEDVTPLLLKTIAEAVPA